MRRGVELWRQMMNRTESRKQLEIWLQEYAVWKELVDALPAESVAPMHEDLWDSGAFPDEPGPEAGQIRLWPSANGACGPFYGLLVAPEYSSWGVLPFSPLSSVATHEELRVMEEAPVQVIQGWNLRRIPEGQAKKSWFAGTLPELEIFRVDLFLTWCGSGEALPPALADYVGPPLIHPLDPRHEYLDEERERADASLGRKSLPLGETGFSLARAAEPEPEYDPDPEPE
jgi:hypothetical protein